MPVAGCRNPNAVNFDPSAGVEDYSCEYLFKNQGNCHLFTDVQPSDVIDRSFTLSYSIKGKGWVFFHDYFPDFYLQTRNRLFSLKDGGVYEHNTGLPGQYYSGTSPFFIDIIFANDADIILDTVNWVSEFLSSNTDQPFTTLTHLTIWNSYQHSGKITLSTLFQDLYQQTRKTKGQWVFNDFRNILVAKGVPFLLDLFNNFLLDGTKADVNLPWYNKELMADKWFCVRFEFSNPDVSQLILHDIGIEATKSDR